MIHLVGGSLGFSMLKQVNHFSLSLLLDFSSANFIQYQTLRKMSNLRLPAVVHFVSDGKPWKVIAMEYLNVSIPFSTLSELKKQEYVHIFWRIEFFKATGDAPPVVSSFGPEVDEIFQNILSQHQKESPSGKKIKQENKQNFIEKLEILYERNRQSNEEEAKSDKVKGKMKPEVEKKQKTRRSEKQKHIEEEEAEEPSRSSRRQGKRRKENRVNERENKESAMRGKKERKRRREEL
jgi:lipopolysaccharide biosynthesis glycosyltransferase